MQETRDLSLNERLAYRIPEACTVTGLSRSTLFRQMKAGKLKPVHVGRRVLITRDELIRFLGNLPTVEGTQSEAA